MASRCFYFHNAYSESRSKYAVFIPNALTIVVGHNGYGKSSYISGLESHLKRKGIEYIKWSDSANGRTNGMNQFLWAGDNEGVASMAFHSEGQAMMASFSRICIRECGRKAKLAKDGKLKELFVIIDQLDSGLDVYWINDLKRLFKKSIIPNMNKYGVTVYVVMTANSYELAKGEHCFDPVTRRGIIFNSYTEYYDYIAAQYKNQKDEEGE